MAKDVLFDQQGNIFIFRMKEGFFIKRPMEIRIDKSTGALAGFSGGTPFHAVPPYHAARLQDLLPAAEILADIISGMHNPSLGLGLSEASEANRPLVNAVKTASNRLQEALLIVAKGLEDIHAGDLAKSVRKREEHLRKLQI